MKKTECDDNLHTLEKERDSLPSGSISTKRIKGKEYYYHRIYEGKKLKEKYIPEEDVDSLRADIARRHDIENCGRTEKRILLLSRSSSPMS